MGPGHVEHGHDKELELNSFLKNLLILYWSIVAQTVKNLPAMQKTQVRSLGQEDPLVRGMATHSSILAWRILCTEGPDGIAESQTRLSD